MIWSGAEGSARPHKLKGVKVMKRIFTLLLAIMMLFALSACGGEAAPAPEVGELNTLGDALSVESELNQLTMDSERFVYVFEYNGAPTRVVANMTEELYEAASEVFFDDDANAKMAEILGDLPLESVEDLSLGIPDQKTLDQLIGKTGQELLDEGYEVCGYWEEDNEASFYLVQGPYEYTGVFEKDAPLREESSYEDNIRDLTLKSIVYTCLSPNATDL